MKGEQIMKYYYKSKKGNKVLCLDHPIEQDSRYSHCISLFLIANESDYQRYVAQKEARIEISRLERELATTDWVVVKIAEETDAEEIEALRSKYAEVITARKAKRARINELEASLL